MYFIMQENSKNNILVSIVIPVYNGENYLAATLDSLLTQSHKNLEIIVVNDGSIDSSSKIIETYIAKYSFIQCIHKNNSGVSSARNSGLAIAKGDFISFLDADDIWLPENIELKLDFMILHSNAFGVTSYCEIIDEKSNNTGEIKKGDAIVSLKNILAWKGNYITIPSGILFRTADLKNLNGFNTELSNNADQEILMRALFTRKTFHTLQKVSWKYRRHSQNMSSNIQVMEKDTSLVYRLADQNKWFESWRFKRECMSKMSLILAFSWWKNGQDKMRSVKWIFQSFYYSPLIFTERILHKLFSRITN